MRPFELEKYRSVRPRPDADGGAIHVRPQPFEFRLRQLEAVEVDANYRTDDPYRSRCHPPPV